MGLYFHTRHLAGYKGARLRGLAGGIIYPALTLVGLAWLLLPALQEARVSYST